MALAADRKTRETANGTSRTRVGLVAAATVIYRGGLWAKNVGGYLVPASDAAALKVVGVGQETVDNTAGGNGALTATYLTGVEAEFANAAGGAAVVQADFEGRCYVSDDQTVQTKTTSNHRIIAGIVTQFDANNVFVFIDETVGNETSTALVNGAVSPAVLSSGAIECIPIDIPDAATATYVYVNADKIEIIDVAVIKDTAGAGNTIQITDSADVAISNAIAAAVDKTRTSAGTLDKAKRTLNASAGFKVVATRAAGSMACQVFLYVIKR